MNFKYSVENVHSVVNTPIVVVNKMGNKINKLVAREELVTTFCNKFNCVCV